MKLLLLTLLGSKKVIQADVRPSFTCVLMCHTSSPKGKSQNLLSSNSVAGAYPLACWLANPNVHRLLMTGKLLTPALTKRLSLIIIWSEFSQRAPIPIVNRILKMVYNFGGRWVAKYYSASPKYNKTTNNFRNRLPTLFLTC